MSGRAGATPPPAPSPGRLGGPPWWFYAAIGLAAAVAIVIFLMRSGDGDETAATSSPVSTPTAPSPTATATEAPPATAAPTPSPEPSAPEGVALGASCSSDPEGYGIDYPAGWFAPSDPAWACQLFDPQPFVVEPDTEPPIVAVTVYVDPNPFGKVRRALSDPAIYAVLSESEGTFGDAARPGTILETEQLEDLLWPAGTRSFSVLVDRLESTIVVTTNDLTGEAYEQNKQIALAMAMSLRISG